MEITCTLYNTVGEGIVCHWDGNDDVCSSDLQISPTTPVKRVPGVPDGVGTEEGELAAVLRDLADLGHLHPVAELGQDRPVPRVDHSSCSNLQRNIGTFVAVPFNFGDQVFISDGLPLESGCHVVGGVPGHSQLHQLDLLGLPSDDNEVRLLSRHGQVGRDGYTVHSMSIQVSIYLHVFQPLGREECVEILDQIVVAPLKPVEGLFAAAQHVTKSAGGGRFSSFSSSLVLRKTKWSAGIFLEVRWTPKTCGGRLPWS